MKNNSYIYTFDDVGYFCVASQGAPGYAGTVTVINAGMLRLNYPLCLLCLLESACVSLLYLSSPADKDEYELVVSGIRLFFKAY